MKKESPGFYYGWVIIAVSFLTLFLAVGVRTSFGIFYIAILEDFGWGRGETAGAFSLTMFVHALFAPITGNLIDRFNPRKLFPMGAVFLTIGLLGASRIHEIWHLYLFFGVVIAIGVNLIGFGPHMAIIPRWFIRKRGLASGLALSGIGLGALIVVPLTAFFIETIGWRAAFLILAGIIFCIITPATAFFQRRSPEEVGMHPDNPEPELGRTPLSHSAEDAKESDRARLSEDWTFKAAIRTHAFWWISLAAFSHGFMVNMLLVHQAVHIVDAGYSQLLAASILGLVGFLGSVGGILFGFISDRFGRKSGITLGGLASFAGICFILFIQDTNAPWMLFAFAVLYGMGQGSFSPIYASTMGDFFSGPSLGVIMSTLSIGYGFGGAISSYAGGYFHDQMGSYLIPFLMLLVAICIGTLGIWMADAKGNQAL